MYQTDPKSHKHSLIINALKTESSSLAACGLLVDEAKFLANNFATIQFLILDVRIILSFITLLDMLDILASFLYR